MAKGSGGASFATWKKLVAASNLRAMASPVLSLGAGQIVESLAVLVGITCLARVLTPTELGQIVFAQATVGILFAILDPRVEDGVIRYVPLIGSREGPGVGARLYQRALLFDQLLGGGAAVLAIVLVGLSAVSTPSATTQAFLVLALVQAGLQAPMGTLSAGFAVTDGLALLGVFRAGSVVISTAVAVTALFLGGGSAYMTAQALMAALVVASMMLIVQKRIRATYGRRDPWKRGAASGFAWFTIKSSLATTLSIGSNNLPLTLVGSIAGSPALAGFRISLAPSRLASTAFSPVAAVMFPALSKDAAAGRFGDIRRKALSWTGMLVPVALVGAVLAWFTLPALVPAVFGQRYSGVVSASWIFVCAAVVRGLVVWAKVLPLAVGRAGLRLGVTAVDTVLVVGATWWGITHGDLETIAWGQLAVAVAYASFWLVVAAKIGDVGQSVSAAEGQSELLEELHEGSSIDRT